MPPHVHARTHTHSRAHSHIIIRGLLYVLVSQYCLQRTRTLQNTRLGGATHIYGAIKAGSLLRVHPPARSPQGECSTYYVAMYCLSALGLHKPYPRADFHSPVTFTLATLPLATIPQAENCPGTVCPLDTLALTRRHIHTHSTGTTTHTLWAGPDP